jgi:adenosylmethionine-8-amino-7-oxononanoate aminotransferase
LQNKIALLSVLLAPLVKQPHVAEVRQCGFIAGIEITESADRPYDAGLQMGARVCMAARKYGLLTRPVRDTIVLMPPYCISDEQLRQAVDAISLAIREVC